MTDDPATDSLEAVASAFSGTRDRTDETVRRVHSSLDGPEQQAALNAWRIIMANWGVLQERDPVRLRSAIRRGIPPPLRGQMWMTLTGASQLALMNLGVYEQTLGAAGVPSKLVAEISRDVSRTFPKHQMFRDWAGAGQRTLFNVLRAYAAYDPDIGYCQGMGFIVCLFLTHLTEESAFWLLVSTLRRRDMRELFAPHMPRFPLLMDTLTQLVAHYLPELHAHMQDHGIVPSMFASKWFITVFTSDSPMDVVVRIWDCVLAEGWCTVFRVALAVLRHQAASLMRTDLEGALLFMKQPLQLDAATLMATAFDFDVRGQTMQQVADFADALSSAKS